MGALKLSKIVSVDVVDPSRNFYVEAAHVGHLINVLAGRSVPLLVGPRQSGKTTDAQAVLRRLRKAGYQVGMFTAPVAAHVICLALHTTTVQAESVADLWIPFDIWLLCRLSMSAWAP